MFPADTLLELSTPTPFRAELSYSGMLWMGRFE